MNKENIQKVIDVIEDNPHSWNQDFWHCKTTHCFSGHAQIISGKQANKETVRTDARIFLDMDIITFNWVSKVGRTLDDFKSLLTNTKFDIDGFDKDGYDIAGFDRDGFDRDEFDRDCFDRNSYNSDGFDRSGLNSDGYDRDGLDINNKSKVTP